jgi:hypothetical protein
VRSGCDKRGGATFVKIFKVECRRRDRRMKDACVSEPMRVNARVDRAVRECA